MGFPVQSAAHGNAGEASMFLVLADRKLKENGTLALVMPLSLLGGMAWEKSRQLLKSRYKNLILISISGVNNSELSFSADAAQGECLIIGTKGLAKEKRAVFIILKKCPNNKNDGLEISRQIKSLLLKNSIRKLEEGPIGGTPIEIGDENLGFAIEAPLPESGSWRLSRVADISLAQTAYQLNNKNRVWLPGQPQSEAFPTKLKKLSEIGNVGPYHMDINGNEKAGGAIRGPFDIKNIAENGAPTYPVIWSHNAETERLMLISADKEGVIRKGKTSEEEKIINERALRIWKTASKCHFNRDFRFNSQSTAFTFTPVRTIGGRAWPSVILPTHLQEMALTLWGNCTLGLLNYWWFANKQQSGRGSIPITALASLPVLDVVSLSKNQLTISEKIFEDFKQKPFLPFNEINKDSHRKELDKRFLVDVLGFPKVLFEHGGSFELLRNKLFYEPSIAGSKKN